MGLNEDRWKPLQQAQLFAESGFDPGRPYEDQEAAVNALSPVGAQGPAQFMPGTWQEMIDRGYVGANDTPFDPDAAMRGQTAYMNQIYDGYQRNLAFFRNADEDMRENLALAAYNAGPARISALVRRYGDSWLDNAPAETQGYVRKIRQRVGQQVAAAPAEQAAAEPVAEGGEEVPGETSQAPFQSTPAQDVAPGDLPTLYISQEQENVARAAAQQAADENPETSYASALERYAEVTERFARENYARDLETKSFAERAGMRFTLTGAERQVVRNKEDSELRFDDDSGVVSSFFAGLVNEGPAVLSEFLADVLDGFHVAVDAAQDAVGVPENARGGAGVNFLAESLRFIDDFARLSPQDLEESTETLGEKIAFGLGRAISGDLPKYLVAMRMAGYSGGMAGVPGYDAWKAGATELEIGFEAMKGFMLGKVFRAVEPLGKGIAAGAGAFASGAEAAAYGAEAEDVTAAAVMGGVFGGWGAKKEYTLREFIAEPRAVLGRAVKTEAQIRKAKEERAEQRVLQVEEAIEARVQRAIEEGERRDAERAIPLEEGDIEQFALGYEVDAEGNPVRRTPTARQPRIIATRDSVVPRDEGGADATLETDDGGSQRIYLRPEETVVEHADLPDELYHVTSAGDAIESEGVLLASRASMEDGGLGGDRVGLSLTDRATAEWLQTEMLIVAAFAEADQAGNYAAALDLLQRVSDTDAENVLPAGRSIYGEGKRGESPAQLLDKKLREAFALGDVAEGGALEAVRQRFEAGELRTRSGKEVTRETDNLIPELFSAYKTYLTSRGLSGYRADPLIFGGLRNSFGMLRTQDVRIVPVKRGQIPQNALVTRGEKITNETRVYADLDVREGTQPATPREAAEQRGAPRNARRPRVGDEQAELDSRTGKRVPKPIDEPTQDVEGVTDRLDSETSGPNGPRVTGWRSIFEMPKPKNQKEATELVRRSEIIKELANALDIEIRTGRLGRVPKSVLGWFKPFSEVIRIRHAEDVPTAAHEAGHLIDKRVFGMREGRFEAYKEELRKIQTVGDVEAEGFAEFVALYVENPGLAVAKAPEFAKFFEQEINSRAPEVMRVLERAQKDYQLWLQQPASAMVRSTKVGRDILKEGYKRRHSIVDAVFDGYDALRRLENAIVGKPSRDWKFKRQQFSNIDAANSPFTLARLLGGVVEVANSFVKPGREGGGQLDYNTRKVIGPSLTDILAKIPENSVEAFDDYLMARRFVELLNRPAGKRPRQTPLDKATYEQAIKELETPAFKKAAEEIDKYNDNLLRYLAFGGMITWDQYHAIKKLDEFYVPLHRLVESEMLPSEGWTGQKMGDLFEPLQHMVGSSRPVLSPIESIIKNTYSFINLVHRNEVNQALYRLAQRPRAGKYLEIIEEDAAPVPLGGEEVLRMMKKFITPSQGSELDVKLQNGFAEIERIMVGSGPGVNTTSVLDILNGFKLSNEMINRVGAALAKGKLQGNFQQVLKEQKGRVGAAMVEGMVGFNVPDVVLDIFRPVLSRRGEPIVTARVRGEKKHLLIADPDTYNSVMALGFDNLNLLTRVLALPAKALRFGAIATPEFFLGTNVARDQVMAWINTKYGYKPVYDWVRGIMALQNRAKFLKPDNSVEREYWTSGAAMSNIVSVDRRSLNQMADEVVHQAGIAKPRTILGTTKRAVTNAIETLRAAMEFTENATRYSEFARGVAIEQKALSQRVASGLMTEAQAEKEAILRAGFNAREVSIDFGRIGQKTRAINAISAFWNPSMQGLSKVGRQLADDPVGASLKMGSISMISGLLWHANRDNVLYDIQEEWKKDQYWIIPTGHITQENWDKLSLEEKAEYVEANPVFLFPKPHEVGLLTGTGTEHFLSWLSQNHPDISRDVAKTFGVEFEPAAELGRGGEFGKKSFEQLVLSRIPTPTALHPVAEINFNYSTFRDAPIVSRGQESLEPFMQAANRTPKVLVDMARAVNAETGINYSPEQLNYFVQASLGGLGRIALDTANDVYKAAVYNELPEYLTGEFDYKDAIIVRKFMSSMPKGQTRYVNQLYETRATLDKQLKTFKELGGEVAQGSDDLFGPQAALTYLKSIGYENMPSLQIAHRFVQASVKQMSNLRKATASVRENMDLTPEQRENVLLIGQIAMSDFARETMAVLDDVAPGAVPRQSKQQKDILRQFFSNPTIRQSERQKAKQEAAATRETIQITR